MNNYLIAYIARNERVMSDRVEANSQAEAIRLFELWHPFEIIAITLLEE